LTFNFVSPRIGRYFNTNFSVLLINYIYNNWTTSTGVLAKPASMDALGNTIDFRAGIIDEDTMLQVTTLQGQTRVGQPDGNSGYLQTGQKEMSFLTQIFVTLKAESPTMGDTSDRLRVMEQELLNICGTYKQSNQTPGTDMYAIEDLIYDTGERIYMPEDDFDKTDWRSVHTIWLWYILADIT